MKENEKLLFKGLCNFKDSHLEPSLMSFATPEVLGHLFANRMQGIAYDVLKNNGLLNATNREFRNSLRLAYEQNVQLNHSFQECIKLLLETISSCRGKVALLKGAYLCLHYPEGYRTSNDIDLLVHPNEITELASVLNTSGFRQGKICNEIFVPATRREIIESRMMRGETIPFIYEVNLPLMKYLEVDINFSLDYKNGDENCLSHMLAHTCTKYEKGLPIITLNDEDFFIHLCAHLYKEATTLPWIEMRRDMTLYKYCDIYLLLSEMTNSQLRDVLKRATELEMEKICAYAILETMKLFDIDNHFAHNISRSILEEDPLVLLKVFSPKDKKTFIYRTSDVTERFFMESRINDLVEVSAQ